jgi:hypothetical protein
VQIFKTYFFLTFNNCLTQSYTAGQGIITNQDPLIFVDAVNGKILVFTRPFSLLSIQEQPPPIQPDIWEIPM